ncbi:MAG: hypothetical protein LBI44_07675 [Oscillospiraceae bacterium]|jgi:hypothetical protein|nr:hypothetical protein [Oscillospiraceae bacterium]
MSGLFGENMTSSEARRALYSAYEGKTKEERALLFEEYKPVANAILDREIDLAHRGWMMG